ncbi:MAG: glycosyl transferase [Rhodovulum sulfidophilum]|uniref:Glycosyl transferase n=1 Tax=Rhodovulum sulfidophilum TaxID=35806 RepID=A0A2W5Q4W6_RHOSU|nr:MAG: glycosyl transferase [Rhodovulum sulfidophilum]
MRRLYINLDRSPDRRDFMEAQARRLGVAMERLAAVDGRAISEEEYARLCPEGRGRRLARGELACFLSHVAAWRLIAEGDAPYGAVFEDDVYVSDALAPLLTDTGWIPAGADVVKLTGNPHRFTLAAAPTAEVGSRSVHRMLTPTIDSGGYLVSATHARRLCDALSVHTLPIDRHLMNPTPGTALYQLAPAAAVQSKFADFTFLDEPKGKSLIQTEKPRRARRTIAATIRGELRNLRAKVLRPLFLPVRQVFTPKSRRVMITAVPFRR